MASVYDISGTSHHSFKIGDGPTFYYGNIEPSSSIGNVGDVYILTTAETNNSVISVGSMYIKSNINNTISWIKLGSGNGGQVDLSNYVSVIQQLFSEQQKKQARDNIDATGKPKIVETNDNDISIIVDSNTIYNCSNVLKINIDANNIASIMDISEIYFTSGEQPTTITHNLNKIFGDDVNDNVFNPSKNTRYNLMIYYDGIFKQAIVHGVKI